MKAKHICVKLQYLLRDCFLLQALLRPQFLNCDSISSVVIFLIENFINFMVLLTDGFISRMPVSVSSVP